MAESGQLPFRYLVAKHLTSKSLRWLAIGGNSDAPLVSRTNTLLLELTNSTLPSICQRRTPAFRYWTEKTPSVDLSLSLNIKAGQHSSTVLPHFYQLLDRKYKTTTHIYTDGSKTIDDRVGCGIDDPSDKRSIALPTQCSVFSAEAYAVLNALQNTQQNHSTPPTIFSDSASVLKAVSKGNIKHPWISSIASEALNKKATLVWIPGHAGIPGNESADRLASIGANLTPSQISIPQQDAYRYTSNQLSLAWERDWANNRTAKLREVKNCPRKWIDRQNPRERTALTRLRIGHTRLSQSYLLDRDNPPICPSCSCVVSVKHILVDCSIYEEHRAEHQLASSLRQILANCPDEEKKLISFLASTNLLPEI
ncbi:uncharacterized protein LOC129758185 [Uranotaenia lowii]|uniref:uncharacterized protein LOC129758185 n=1 Tax=Uranotaenia lowii TaxID=190385 RepID=UPI002479B399|nr:uncharacterized protein LOC129758185 [Uranotaenia lowii]